MSGYCRLHYIRLGSVCEIVPLLPAKDVVVRAKGFGEKGFEVCANGCLCHVPPYFSANSSWHAFSYSR
jgi:hypothetical protein